MKLRKTQVEIEGQVHERWVVEEGAELEPWGPGAELAHVGRGRTRVDGIERVTGRAVYTTDLLPVGLLHARFFRSPHAHARLESLDTDAARSLPGVREILVPGDADLAGIDWPGFGGAPVLSEEPVYAGQEVALVCADSRDAAEAAVRALARSASWRVLPHHLTAREGLIEDSHSLHEEGNLVGGAPETYERGDPDEGWKEAEIQVEETFTTPTCLHNALETHGGVAWWEGENLVLHTSTQHVFGVRRQMAEALDVPLSRVRVLSPFMGGGFGAKNNATKADLAAALLSRLTGRPVRCVLDRKEENLTTGNRPASEQRVRIGARRDGTLIVLELEGWVSAGAFATWGVPVAGPLKTLYACPNVRVKMHHVRTHTGPQAAFRAPGYVEGAFALEGALDVLASNLDLDPLELRRKNYAQQDQVGSNPYTSKGLGSAYEKGAEAFEWDSRQSRRCDDDPRYRRGFGCASQIWGGGGGPPAYATVQIQPDGTALVATGTQDLGTGTRTVMTQIAAEELGFAEDSILLEIGDTQGPYAPLSAGSMTVASVGPAVRAAAAEAASDLKGVAATMLGCEPAEISFNDGDVLRKGEKVSTVGEITAELGNVMIFGRGSRGPNPDGRTINTFACHFVQVRVDTWTGRVELERYVAAHDSGRIINPLTANSQVDGGVLQGAVGFALMEDRMMDPVTGIVLDPGLESYKIPTLADAPAVEKIWVDPGDTECNTLGAKGVGEPPIIPAPAAVANAVADALGVRIHVAPLAPWRILEALQRKAAGGNGETP